MNPQSEKKFLKTAAEAFDVKTSSVTLASNKENTEGWDSLGHMKLFLALEKEFRVNFTSKEISECEALDELYEILNKKIRKHSA